MKLSTAFIALASLFGPAVLAADFALFATTHEEGWSLFGSNPHLEQYRGPLSSVKLVDGQGEQLNVVTGHYFDASHPWGDFIILYQGGQIQCKFEKNWPEEKFNVGDITMILKPRHDSCDLDYELRTRASEGKAAILDPLRFKGGCTDLQCAFGGA